MGTSGYLDDWGCLNIDGTVVVECFDDLIPSGGYVKIPEGVTSIGKQAFAGCKSLASVTIPEGVTSIGWRAFAICDNLEAVALPRSVRRIEDWAFSSRACLTVYYAGKEVNWRSISWGEEVFEPGTRVRYNWQGPAPVFKKSTGRTDLTSVVIPDGTTEILTGEYESCENLRSVTIPRSVTSIRERAFFCCNSLTSVVIPRSVTSIGVLAFSNCYSLTSVTIPESVTSIGENAFGGCKSLTSVTIPESVTSIGVSVFNGCKSLTSVAIPRSVTKIGKNAFEWCENLTIYYAGSEADWKKVRQDVDAFDPGTKIQYNWQGPAPGDVARERPPRKQAAGGVPRQDTAQRQKPPKKPAGGGTARGAGGFDLTNMTIPDGTTEIRPCAFMGCATLESVVIPGSVTRIGENAFAGCSRLASVTFSKGVAHIGTDAFSGCPLKEVHYGGGKDEWLAITGDRPRSKGIKVNLYPKGLPS